MADAAMKMTDAGGELVLSGFDLARDDGLETALIISLFTDRRASNEQLPAELPQEDLRGYWGDISNASPSDQTGSLLWLLAREKQGPHVLSRAQQYCREALAWMIDDLVAKRVEVAAEFIGQGWMLILIDIYRPAGSPVRYRFNYEWAAQAAKRSV
ncbi:phage GP46 family protein [Pseudomonas asiatica]|uniref:Phage GP46 family protein n=1 Tax=Pseudomonas asiatica TaxID=2219225 RepID=A0A9X4D7Y8_9PSED|nr:phage GP46 family protein [Pseudomonas asiatica]MDD2109303.1 phage GP46 family protein [Pseudomonas asiatica]